MAAEVAMSVYAVVQSRIENREKLNEYLVKAGPTLAGRGKVLSVDENAEVLEGKTDRTRVVLLEFETREALDEWYSSAEYQAVLPLRLEATEGTCLIAKGLPGA
jgi:uncharacterized protein (DUF1330 family)